MLWELTLVGSILDARYWILDIDDLQMLTFQIGIEYGESRIEHQSTIAMDQVIPPNRAQSIVPRMCYSDSRSQAALALAALWSPPPDSTLPPWFGGVPRSRAIRSSRGG